MRRPQVRTAVALTALLLIGLTGSALPLLNQTSGALDEDQTRFPTSGRSTSAEIFLTGGGSSSHDEFAGSIATSGMGYYVLSLIHI